MLSLAGSIGKQNKHLYKNEVQAKLGDPDIFDTSITSIIKKFGLNDCMGTISKADIPSTKDAILTALASQES